MDKIVSGILIGTLLISIMLFFCVILIRLYFNKMKKHTQELYQKDVDFQKSLNETIMETQEQVLTNISQDLHDDAGQQLTYINLQLESLKYESAALQAVLEPVSKSVATLSESIRGISRSLNNQLLLQEDLFVAMTTEVERIRKHAKQDIVLTITDSNAKVFTANEKIIIYRIFQELLNNALKHSKAQKISIMLSTFPKFEMVFQDNGTGFLLEKATTKLVSLGLTNMHKRAAIIAYTVTIHSELEQGTTIILAEK